MFLKYGNKVDNILTEKYLLLSDLRDLIFSPLHFHHFRELCCHPLLVTFDKFI